MYMKGLFDELFCCCVVLCIHVLFRGKSPPEPQVNLNPMHLCVCDCVCVCVCVHAFERVCACMCEFQRELLTVPV